MEEIFDSRNWERLRGRLSSLDCLNNWRVLTKDSPENCGFLGEGVKVVVEVVVDPQRQIDHFDDLGDDLRAAAEPR